MDSSPSPASVTHRGAAQEGSESGRRPRPGSRGPAPPPQGFPRPGRSGKRPRDGDPIGLPSRSSIRTAAAAASCPHTLEDGQQIRTSSATGHSHQASRSMVARVISSRGSRLVVQPARRWPSSPPPSEHLGPRSSTEKDEGASAELRPSLVSATRSSSRHPAGTSLSRGQLSGLEADDRLGRPSSSSVKSSLMRPRNGRPPCRGRPRLPVMARRERETREQPCSCREPHGRRRDQPQPPSPGRAPPPITRCCRPTALDCSRQSPASPAWRTAPASNSLESGQNLPLAQLGDQEQRLPRTGIRPRVVARVWRANARTSASA